MGDQPLQEFNEAFEGLGGLSLHQSKDQVVIALDFGTTFSGIAYAFAKDGKPDLVCIMDWPGIEGFKQPKIPTVICYDPHNPKVFTWGAEKHIHKSNIIASIKLLLDPDQPIPLYLPQSTAKVDLKHLPKPAVEVAADYIRAIYNHALAKIGKEVPHDYLAMCQKQFVLSVPAVWSDKAKNNTIKAAKRAGIHPIHLIKEPEAAAIYTLHVLQDRGLAVGDAFVICDAGGGTVDLISYEITQLSPSLDLKELVPGRGGMAGSLGLNKRFESAVKDLVGEDQYLRLRKTKGFEKATEQFDRSIKTGFRGDLDEDYFVNFPMAKIEDDPLNNLESNTWNMKGSDVKAIFDPLITDIERHVDDQVNSVLVKRLKEGHSKANDIKAIFLVGGFGSSEYLKDRLEIIYPHIQVIQPHDAWSAIVKGAVLSRYPQQATIVSTQATSHYGVSTSEIHDVTIDKGQSVHYNPWDGTTRTNRVMWCINRGEDLQREQVLKLPCLHTVEENYTPKELFFEFPLLQSEDKAPPIHPTAPSIKRNCVLKVNFSSLPQSEFEKGTGKDGKVYCLFHYDLLITIKPAVMRFSLEAKGKEMGSVNATFD